MNYGIFTPQRTANKKILLIAGGVGITPIRPIAEALARSGCDVRLLYANKTAQDIILRRELEAISGLDITYSASSGPVSPGVESGIFDYEKIKRIVPDVSERDAYLCGPPRMMDAMIVSLTSLGVHKKRIYYERFSL